LNDSANSPLLDELGQTPSGKKPLLSRSRFWLLALAVILVSGGIGITAMLSDQGKANRPELLLHTAQRENLAVSIVERGTLESAENCDVTCRVKATKGGSFSTVITWVIDDGSQVEQGQHIVTLDSAALDLQLKDQNIAVLNATSLWITAETAYEVTREDNKKLLLAAENALRGAELDVEKYVGLPRGSLASLPEEKRKAFIAELEKDLAGFVERHRPEFKSLDGEFQQQLDDVNGRIELAEAEHEQWKDKAAYSQRMVIKGYITQSQAQADESRLNGATESLKKLRTEKRLLQTFVAQKTVSNYCSLLKEAEVTLLSARISAEAKLRQTKSDLDARKETLAQEKSKLDDIVEQIKKCKIYAPQKGLVVYYVPEQSRYGSGTQQSIIAQGEPVRDNQKLMRIPNLDYMQVVARVHEATISRIKPDKPGRFTEYVRAGAVMGRSFFPPIELLQEEVLSDWKHQYAEQEASSTDRGQAARIRVDAFNDRPLRGHVHSIATVASQDFYTSDVKVYQTVVSIDEKLSGLRPGMSAEVTIQVENPLESVVTVPLQAVRVDSELGETRKVYVMTDAGPVERDVVVGLTNDEKAEIRSGLEEGERVVTNLKALLGDKVKVREAAEPKGGKGKAKGESKKQ
jgi:multidrug resistance efflux pump